MMKKENMILWGLTVLFALLMSVPFIIPHTGFLALFGIVPLLCMERIADMMGKRRIWIYHYSAFVLWNAITTFWVCNATVGGGIFAVLANSLQMSLIFGLFRLSKRKFKGSLPYIFLAVAWIAWERFYFDAEISWPWLVLGNSFARTTWAIQWYEFTGTLGGSLWIWACNLGLFGLFVSISDGSIAEWNRKARLAALGGYAAILILPFIASAITGKEYKDAMTSEDMLDVLIIQPNIDPYNKFQAMTQAQQNGVLLSMAEKAMKGRKNDSTASPLLIVAPETFTSDIICGEYSRSRTWKGFTSFLKDYPNVNLLFGASSYDYFESADRPSHTARQLQDGRWVESHNSALITDGTERTEIFHKSKLVVAVEMTPYPAIFCKIDDLLGGVMGRCVGQDEISLLNVRTLDGENIPVGCAVCYESVYGEYYTDYIRKGALAMTIITNDAWWGDTPGYKQHLSYASLRAIETRRAIARCANTGISAIISPSGKILQPTPWWEPAAIEGSIPLRDDMTFFVSYGDITGRICSFIFILLMLALVVRAITRR
ncbi:MAG: apolipoprotein N-acyltransferase [Bacteroidales bacterium]|nr:apolipoprotein N-acyltransferase [Bacteroidales bacterium]